MEELIAEALVDNYKPSSRCSFHTKLFVFLPVALLTIISAHWCAKKKNPAVFTLFLTCLYVLLFRTVPRKPHRLDPNILRHMKEIAWRFAFCLFSYHFFPLIVSFTHVAIDELKICFRKFTFLKQNTTFGSTCERVNGVNFRRIQLKLVFSAWEEARGTTKESLESTVVNLYLPRPSYLIQTYTCDDALFIS